MTLKEILLQSGVTTIAFSTKDKRKCDDFITCYICDFVMIKSFIPNKILDIIDKQKDTTIFIKEPIQGLFFKGSKISKSKSLNFC